MNTLLTREAPSETTELDSENLVSPFTESETNSHEEIPVPTRPGSPSPLADQLGRLVVDTSIKALAKSMAQYKFTADDALWLARFVEGEAGGTDNVENHAVVWAMFNRFGIFRYAVPAWKDFGAFLRLYSTTLQPLLNSVGAAKRVWQNYKDNPAKYPIVCSEQTYKGTDIKKVQYKKHIDLQQKPWNRFSSEVRNMVIRILNGQIPNPGIGIATHFASTWVYFKTTRRRENIFTDPSYEQWKQYTLDFAKHEHWIWIGERSNLNQIGNAFFIQPQLKDVPAGAVQIQANALSISHELNDESTENELESLQLFSGEYMGDEYVYDETVEGV